MANHTISETLGLHTPNSVQGTIFARNTQHDALIANLINILSYIPIIGSILGCVRLLAVYKNTTGVNPSRWNSGLRVVQAIRGVCEILCCGLLFCIPDLIVSIERHLCRCRSC